MGDKVNKTKFVGVYMEDSFYADIKELADADDRTVSSFVRKALEDAVAAAKAKKAEQ